MRVTSAWASWQSIATAAVAVTVACATQTDASLDSFVSPEGAGGSGVAGATGTGGSTSDATMGTGGTGGSGGSGGSSATGGSGGTTGGTNSQTTGGSDAGGSLGTGTAGRASGRAGTGGSTTVAGGRGGRTGVTTGRAGTTAMTAQGGGTAAGSGCAKLSVPLNAATDKAHFVTSLTTTADLSRATISMRYYVQAGSGGVIFNYVQDSSDRFLGAAMAMRTAIAMSVGTWNTVTWDVGTEPAAMTGITKTAIKRIGIEVNAAGSTMWENPTVILVDSITVTTPARTFSFDAAATVSTMASSTDVASQALWLNSGSSDTTAARSALSWQATCP